jgi:hypothetical protein
VATRLATNGRQNRRSLADNGTICQPPAVRFADHEG